MRYFRHKIVMDSEQYSLLDCIKKCLMFCQSSLLQNLFVTEIQLSSHTFTLHSDPRSDVDLPDFSSQFYSRATDNLYPSIVHCRSGRRRGRKGVRSARLGVYNIRDAETVVQCQTNDRPDSFRNPRFFSDPGGLVLYQTGRSWNFGGIVTSLFLNCAIYYRRPFRSRRRWLPSLPVRTLVHIARGELASSTGLR